MPITIPGVTPLNGNMNPVMLVSAVVIRNSSVHNTIFFDAIIPKITRNPAAMPTRLIATCTCVNRARLIPRIMLCVLSRGRNESHGVGSDFALRAGRAQQGPGSNEWRGAERTTRNSGVTFLKTLRLTHKWQQPDHRTV